MYIGEFNFTWLIVNFHLKQSEILKNYFLIKSTKLTINFKNYSTYLNV